MSETKAKYTQEQQIKFLDEEIRNTQSWIEDGELWEGENDMSRQVKFRDMLTEIKGIVEQQPRPVDEELVKKLLMCGRKFETDAKAKEEIRKLLKGEKS